MRRVRKPLVSVITPAYNAAQFIAETIASVRTQSHDHWEMLITDDGSSDATVEIVERIAVEDPRVKLLRLARHTGLAAKARNHSMQMASGDYLAFLDADDVWEPRKLEQQAAYLESHPEVDAVCSWYYVFGDPARVQRYREMMWRFETTEVTVDQILMQSLFTSTVMMRARCCEELGGMDESPALSSGQDYEYFVRLVARYRVHRLCEELSGYRLAPAGGSLSTKGQRLERRRQREEAILEALAGKQVLTPALLRRRRAIMHYNLARDCLFELDQPYRGFLWRAVRTWAAPPKAYVMFLLSFLPARQLRCVLTKLLALRQSRLFTGRK
ncbi:MAG TPA: glycosyltransferase family 2 protein [Candidatus Sumerlaeota bacterium]|nr:glycosyltransferase family 2 protein [Candidatus Sumerlaeota bacterium]HOR27868.1 glycosyltransferase family 2 protein [Candidatus Sumerlaeota bacterium]HPK00919.1 glycosyltransferase family 2 protein [Candidatus Sumerlaeota bacterium]